MSVPKTFGAGGFSMGGENADGLFVGVPLPVWVAGGEGDRCDLGTTRSRLRCASAPTSLRVTTFRRTTAGFITISEWRCLGRVRCKPTRIVAGNQFGGGG